MITGKNYTLGFSMRSPIQVLRELTLLNLLIVWEAVYTPSHWDIFVVYTFLPSVSSQVFKFYLVLRSACDTKTEDPKLFSAV